MSKAKIPPPTITKDRAWVFHEWKLPKGFRLRKTIAPWKKPLPGNEEGHSWEVVDPSSDRGEQGWAVAPDFFKILLKLAVKPRAKKRKKN